MCAALHCLKTGSTTDKQRGQRTQTDKENQFFFAQFQDKWGWSHLRQTIGARYRRRRPSTKRTLEANHRCTSLPSSLTGSQRESRAIDRWGSFKDVDIVVCAHADCNSIPDKKRQIYCGCKVVVRGCARAGNPKGSGSTWFCRWGLDQKKQGSRFERQRSEYVYIPKHFLGQDLQHVP